MRVAGKQRERWTAVKRSFQHLCRDRSGVAAIEFLLCLLPFCIAIFGILEVGIVLAASIVLENGTQRVSRQILTGQLQQGTTAMTQEQFTDLVCGNIDFFLECDKLQVDLRTFTNYADIDMTYDPNSSYYELGNGNEINVLSVHYQWEWTTSLIHKAMGDDTALLSSVAAFRNEPF